MLLLIAADNENPGHFAAQLEEEEGEEKLQKR